MTYADLLKGAALAGALALSATATAWAAPGGAVREACAADVHELCPGTKPGGGRIVACMRQNEDRLSQGCRQAVQAAKAARQ